jgi:hypothetical protein
MTNINLLLCKMLKQQDFYVNFEYFFMNNVYNLMELCSVQRPHAVLIIMQKRLQLEKEKNLCNYTVDYAMDYFRSSVFVRVHKWF